MAKASLDRKATAIAYETVGQSRWLPLLMPMSGIAGRTAAQIGARLQEKPSGGQGILLGGAPGVSRDNVVVVGGGAVGMNAALIAAGLGARVTILEKDPDRIRQYAVANMPGAVPRTSAMALTDATLPYALIG